MKIMILATAALVAATFSAAAQSVTTPGGEDGPGAGGIRPCLYLQFLYGD
jgi:Spy/CpxP family protein refolding chaperone